MRRLIHYSYEPLTEVYSVKQDDSVRGHRGWLKPFGLWVSCQGDGDWIEWCEAESWRDYKHATQIVLAREANILRITNSAKWLEFDRNYVTPSSNDYRPEKVHWEAVARSYQGIIICPHLGEHRLSMDNMWYNGWDCASGCIWDKEAIARLVPLPEEQARLRRMGYDNARVPEIIID